MKKIGFSLVLLTIGLACICCKQEDNVDLTTDPQNFSGLFEATIVHDGIDREYLLYVPESYTGTEAVPLVFSLHGAIGSKEKQYNLSRFNEVADKANFILVTPEATVPNLVTFWNNDSDPAQADDVGFIDALIDEIASKYQISLERIYAAGSSNGGYMCLQLACELSDRIAAVAAVKGVMNETQLNDCMPSRPVAIIQMHGTEDNNVTYSKVAPTLDFWKEYNQTDTVAIETDLPDTDPNNENTVRQHLFANGKNGTVVEHLEVIGGKHDWFGEPGTNYDIDATEKVWAFFDKYDINGLR
ncbi:MAG: PHB depolymerase family esterase [Bacteroidota bacterium]